MRFSFLTQKVLPKNLQTVCFQLMTQDVISHYLRQIFAETVWCVGLIFSFCLKKKKKKILKQYNTALCGWALDFFNDDKCY